jgi:hypothetical protein
MERAIKEEKENVDPLLVEFGSALKTVMDGTKLLEERLSAQKEAEPSSDFGLDAERVKGLLQDMVQLLESDLTEAMNRLEALRPHLANSPAGEEFKRLEKQVESFDTDGAFKSIEAVAQMLGVKL